MVDELKRYLLPGGNIRIQAVRLEQAWQTGLAHQALPPEVRALLGELVAAASLLAASLKFDGSLVLQVQGDGPVALLVAECTPNMQIRATASLREGEKVPAGAGFQALLNAKGQGRCLVVLDPRSKTSGMQPYQGIVPLEGHSLAQALEHYMHNSEQLQTRLWLAADGAHCAGLMLQRLPGEGGHATPASARPNPDNDWQELQLLLDTVRADELLATPTDTLIHRLLWSHELVALSPSTLSWHCPCNRERVGNMLRMLGEKEIHLILQEQGKIEVSCNFCGKPYHFDPIDSAHLFTGTLHSPAQNAGRRQLH